MGKQQLAKSALDLQSNRQISNEQLDQGWTGIQNAATASNNNQKMAAGQAFGGTIGGLGGAAASAVLGAPFAPAFIAGGASLMAGIGGQLTPQQRQTSYYTPGMKTGGW